MAKDLAKFLHFCSPLSLDLENVVKSVAVDEFVEHLKSRNIGPSGIISKLNVLCYAQDYIVYK